MNRIREHCGDIALIGLLVSTWLLMALARGGIFHLWGLVLPLLLIALMAALWAWWHGPWHTLSRTPWPQRLVIGFLAVTGALFFTPPAEHLPLSGDSAIYPNEAAFLARIGGLTTTYAPLAQLPPETHTLFYVSNEEQFSTITLASYAGLLYGGYYVIDAADLTIRTSRMSLSTVWLALLYKLGLFLPSDGGTDGGTDGRVGPEATAMHLALYATSIFATLSLILLYLIGRHFFPWPIALWVALLLAVSLPQIHFGRAPYAEITGQFWTLAGLLYGLRWIERRVPWLLGMVLVCWVTTWAGRIDALLLLGSVGVLLLHVAATRDRRSLRIVLLLLPLLLLGIWLSTNGTYVSATYEILLSRWPWFGRLLIALLLVLIVAIVVMWFGGRMVLTVLRRIAPLLHLLIFVGFAFIVLWATIPNPLRQSGVTRNFQEIIWFSSQLITPGLYWLALVGVGWLLWHLHRSYADTFAAKEFWLLTTFLLLAIAFFYTYTTAAVYPSSLRRLISDVIPLLTLMAGFGLTASWQWLTAIPGWGVLRGGVAVGLLAWMLVLSRPFLLETEGTGTLATLDRLHTQLPAESFIFFEHQDGDSWIGWLAAPLYSLYGDRALLFDSDTPDPTQLAVASAAVLAAGDPLYIASQHEPLPAPLLPPGYAATLVQQLVWQSMLVGYAPTPYPLPIWHFAHPIYLYQLTETGGE